MADVAMFMLSDEPQRAIRGLIHWIERSTSPRISDQEGFRRDPRRVGATFPSSTASRGDLEILSLIEIGLDQTTLVRADLDHNGASLGAVQGLVTVVRER